MDELFKIYPISEEDVRTINASVNEPHQHDYEELIVGTEGRLEHFIDFGSTWTNSPYASFIMKGKVHRVQPRLNDAGRFHAWVIRFQSEFIPETIFRLYGFYHEQANIEFEEGYCFERINTLCEMMHREYRQENPDLAIIQHLLQALFIMIESQRRKSVPDNGLMKTQGYTFKNFLAVLEDNFRRPEGVNFYAEKLFMTPRNLNLICQDIVQQSVSEIIETRKLTEAKNLLISTDKSIAEIGFELGYNENSYFTNVFRKKTGQSPTEFRKAMQKLIS